MEIRALVISIVDHLQAMKLLYQNCEFQGRIENFVCSRFRSQRGIQSEKQTVSQKPSEFAQGKKSDGREKTNG
jgi:Rps23 Pro-64 3,4-dihydroxylase Tpa1-like proline 4-hydroxylase